jgi:hypothetical protein
MGATGRSTRVGRRPVLEPLEGRQLLATDLQALGLQALSPTAVRVRYEVVGDPAPSPFVIGVFRSVDDFLAGTDFPLGRVTVDGDNLATGVHEVTIPVAAMGINPALKYVLAGLDIQVDPDVPAGQVVEEEEFTNNVAGFRKWVVGAVTHGQAPGGVLPSWVGGLTAALEGQGYDDAVAVDWAAASALPTPGQTGAAAQATLVQLATAINALPNFGANDVVDVHVIGFSRGGGVMAQAAAGLAALPHTTGGFKKLSLLDPHPARNGGPAHYSASPGPIGRFTERMLLTFQAATADPALAIPAGIDQTELFYQQAPYTRTVLADERFLNLWGEVPAASGSPVSYYNLTTAVPSHAAIVLWYSQQIVPVLGTGGLIALPPSPTPGVPTTGGGSIFPTNRRATPAAIGFEVGLLRNAGMQPGVAQHLVATMGQVNNAVDRGTPQQGVAQINRLSAWIASKRGKTIPVAVADPMLLLLASGRALLYPNARGPRGR